MNAHKLPVVSLMGPTAVGKSDLAIALAKTLDCDLISVDSVMVYKGMDIGTAKPSAKMLLDTAHQLINIREPIQHYSAGDFVRDAQLLIQSSLEKGRMPLLVGGTMLYFHALQQGIPTMPISSLTLREQFNEQCRQVGLDTLYQELIQKDPELAHRIHPQDKQRIQRALAVYTLSGQTLSQWQKMPRNPLPYPLLNIAILPSDREALKETITRRFQAMLLKGLLTEVETLYKNGYLKTDMPAGRAVGYRQILTYLQGKIDYDTMQKHSIIATCQLAKRQLTWLRSWPKLKVFYTDTPQLFDQVLHYIQSAK